jgi:hypothetical protein
MAQFKLAELREAEMQIVALGKLSLDVQLAVRIKRIRKRIAAEQEIWAEQYNSIVEEYTKDGAPLTSNDEGWSACQKRLDELGKVTCEIEGQITMSELDKDLGKKKPEGFANILFALDPLIIYEEAAKEEND